MTNRMTHNVVQYARPHKYFGHEHEDMDDAVTDGHAFPVKFDRPICFAIYVKTEAWIDDHMKGEKFLLTNTIAYFDNADDAVTFKMMFALPEGLIY